MSGINKSGISALLRQKCLIILIHKMYFQL